MSAFKIPKRFQLLGHTITVEHDPAGMYENQRFGCADFEQKVIKLTSRSPGVPVTGSSLEHTFFHELVHMCLNHTEHSSLNKNEEFVDLLAGLLHQAFTTMEHK